MYRVQHSEPYGPVLLVLTHDHPIDLCTCVQHGEPCGPVLLALTDDHPIDLCTVYSTVSHAVQFYLPLLLMMSASMLSHLLAYGV